MTLEELYAEACAEPSDISEHLPTLRKYAAKSLVVLELGTRYGTSTTALLAGQPNVLWTMDVSPCGNQRLRDARGKTSLQFIQADGLEWNTEGFRYDTLFVDTIHTYEQVTAELKKYSPRVEGWIILHDTVSFPPVMEAVTAFLNKHPEWSMIEDHRNNNGLAVLERQRNE